MTNSWREWLRLRGVLLIALATALLLSYSAVSSSPPAQPPPPTEIELSAGDEGSRVQLRDGEVMVISLEANPSTGYAWQVQQGLLAMEGAPILRQTGDQFVAQDDPHLDGVYDAEVTPLLGAPETQILRFQAMAAGETTLRLVYRRPWEEAIPPTDSFYVEVEAIGPFSQDTMPEPDADSLGGETPPATLELGTELGLPSAYNWCDLGDCTSVKNQGACGSCWAFSTVGPLESNILIQNGLDKDLSEQYLLSCNTNGWDCTGGWFAHDYHESKIPPGELDAGAVYEADFPYTAQEDPCNPPHTHHEKIEDWDYVGNGSSIPPIADIKQAILDHGPVSVALCTGSAFRGYDGGIFETHEVCAVPGGVNHAVVLVGWDNNQGTSGVWYLRNSWGPGWGEGGYMRIGYAVSNVGYAANYIVYPGCYDLEVTVHPYGSGTVTADPAPNCGANTYLPDTEVELTAEASPGWHFDTWGGDASGPANPTTLTMDSDKSVAAHFLCDGCSRSAQFPLAMNDFYPNVWMTIVSEDFEGAFPGPWLLFDNLPGPGEYFWGQRDCRAYQGGYSGWAIGDGADGFELLCGDHYPDYTESWMVYGPFSLVGATAADLRFEQWLNTESGYDFLCRGASVNGMDFYGTCVSGYSNGWLNAILDLSNVYTIGSLLGEPEVWIALVFKSDDSISYVEGAYVDDIVLRKYISLAGQPPPPSGTAQSSPCCAEITEQPMVLTRER